MPGNFKRFGGLVFALFVSWLILTACASNTPTPVPAPTSVVTPTMPRNLSATPKEVVNLRWSYWGSDAEVETNKKIAETFERNNPDIKITHVFKAFDKYFTEGLRDEWQGDKIPDVMFLNNIPAYASEGLLENLEPYIRRDNFDIEDFYPATLINFRFNNALHGLPRDSDIKVIYYNKKLFDQAGVPYPKTAWKWEDLRATAQKLTKSDASGKIVQYGYGFELIRWWRLWVWQNEGDLYSPITPPQPPISFLLNSSEAVEALQFMADLINKDKVSPPPDEMSTSGKLQKLFIDGKLAMVFGGSGGVQIYSKVADLSWDIVGMPYFKKRVNISSGAGYIIAKNSRHKEAAWRFLKFLESELGQALYADSGLIVPVRRSIRTDNIISRKQPYNTEVFKGELEVGRPNLSFTTAVEVDAVFDRELAPVWEGKATVAAVLARLPALVEPLLQRR